MSDEQTARALGLAYLKSHEHLVADIEIVGVAAMADINGAVAEVRQAGSIFVSPGFQPNNIHKQEVR